MKLSIITVNRNNADGLRKTIESVVSQTFTDFEYIIIDGASTDGSVEVIKEYAKATLPNGEGLGERLYWVSEPDTGIYNAMNKGILKAKGEYLQFLNSGDWLYDNSVLEAVFGYSYSSDIITGDMLKVYPNGNSVLDKGQVFSRKNEFKDLTLYDMYYGTINHSCSFIKNDLFKHYGFYDENYRIISDWLFFLKLIVFHGVKAEYVDCIVTKFDMSGISNSSLDILVAERKKALEDNIPPQILDDYKFFNELETKYNKIQKEYNFIFHYTLTYRVAKLLNRIIRFFRHIIKKF